MAQIGFKAYEDERNVRAKMQNLRVPLDGLAFACRKKGVSCHTLSITFSKELGQSMAKQTRRRLASGYERGRSRSYSSCPAVSQSANSKVLPEAGWIGWVM